MQRTNKHMWALGALALAMSGVVSCGQAEPRDVPLDAQDQALDTEQTQLLVGSYTNLTARERRDYDEDLVYLRNIAPPNRAVKLNLADPKQLRLLEARLKISGKSRNNSPNLFRIVEQTRDEHVRLGYASGAVAPSLSFRNGEPGRVAMHYLTNASVDGTAGEGAASSTYPDGSDYTFLDVGYYDEAGSPLALPQVIEQFAGGTNVNVQTDADLTLSNLDTYVVDSFQMENSAAGFSASYVYTDTGLANEQPQGNRPPFPVVNIDNVTAPVDQVLNDGLIHVCLDRKWNHGDCDYDLTGNKQSVKLPLAGSFQITSNHVFSENAIDQLKVDLTNGIPNPREGYTKLVLTQVGGGCDVQPGGDALETSMLTFWNNTTLSADAKTLTWDLTGDNAAHFDDGCRQVQDEAYLTMRVHLPIHDPNLGLDWWVSKVLSNNPNQFAPDHAYDPIQITNSCLAAGTLIQMASGELAPVESVTAGDHVWNSTHDGAKGLTVMDTAVGNETAPMVRLEAASEHSVLMTEMHPVNTPDRGIVQAKDLREGDLVFTIDGPTPLTQVSREAYEGKVYNLKLGNKAEKAALGSEDATLVYADGFLVGDGQVQQRHEFKALDAATQGDVLERLPAQWHEDYRRSPLHRP